MKSNLESVRTFRPDRLSAVGLAFAFLLVLQPRGGAAETEADGFHLFKAGRPMAAIVLPQRPPTMPLHVAGSLRHLSIPEDVPSDLELAVDLFRADLRDGYGIELPVISETDAQDATPDALPPNRIELILDPRAVEDEDRTTIDFPAANVMRLRGGEIGLVRTLFFLLEEYAGARYLFQGAGGEIGIGAHFPERESVVIPRETQVRDAAFRLSRASSQTDYGSHWPMRWPDGRSGPRNRTYWWHWEARLGTKTRVPMGHTLPEVAFPVDAYAEAETKPDESIFPILHGERVLPWEGGVRRQSHWQPRFSNPATVDEAVANILAHLRKHPQTVGFSLGVNDGGGHCETEQGREVETYYRWVNAVAERVSAEFPDVRFGVAAYREVEPAPDFPLHSNVVAYLCFDLHSTLDPEVRAGREQLIRDWAAVARIGSYSYNSGDGSFTLPRLYFQEMQQMLRFFHEHGAEVGFSERSYNTATEGPKLYLYYKLLENPDLDLEATIMDWCEAAVGREAAPKLRAYYVFWEDFWRTKAVETSWWRSSKRNIYLSLPPFGTYMLALEPGDMAHCRSLMEDVMRLAERHGCERQQARAVFLMSIFEWYEGNAIASGGEFFQTDGTLPDGTTARAFLQMIPAAEAAAERAARLPHETPGWLAPRITADGQRSAVVGSLSAVTEWLDDPEVVAELERLADHPEVSGRIRFLARIMAKSAAGDADGNLVADGTFATPDHGWEVSHPVHGRVERTDTAAAIGTHSLKCYIDHANFMAQLLLPEGKPHTDYYFSARVYIPEDQAVAEGRLNIWGQGTYRVGDQLHNRGRTRNIPDIGLNPGQWTYVSAIVPGANLTDSLRLVIGLRSFERGDVAYIDDVQVFEIPADAADEDN